MLRTFSHNLFFVGMEQEFPSYSPFHTLPLNRAIKKFQYKATWLWHGNCHVNHVPHWNSLI
jgi:hypothetical protein